jgi:hypothetical protein
MKPNASTRTQIGNATDEQLGDLARRVDRAHTRAVDRGMPQSAQGAADVQDAIGDEIGHRP